MKVEAVMLRSLIQRATLALVLGAVPVAAPAQMPDIPELPEGWQIAPIAPESGTVGVGLAAADIGGAWRYSTSGHGLLACDFPVFPLEPAAGELEIAPHANGVTVTLMTGGNCDPASMCLFEGDFASGMLAMANRDKVDTEGGVAANGWAVAFIDLSRAEGTGTSIYLHPDGWSCSWNYQVVLERGEKAAN